MSHCHVARESDGDVEDVKGKCLCRRVQELMLFRGGLYSQACLAGGALVWCVFCRREVYGGEVVLVRNLWWESKGKGQRSREVGAGWIPVKATALWITRARTL